MSNPFSRALINSPEAVRLSKEWTAAYEERERLKQRVADLGQAQSDLIVAEAALQSKSDEAAVYLDALRSSLMS
jgi:hypothetical protein